MTETAVPTHHTRLSDTLALAFAFSIVALTIAAFLPPHTVELDTPAHYACKSAVAEVEAAEDRVTLAEVRSRGAKSGGYIAAKVGTIPGMGAVDDIGRSDRALAAARRNLAAAERKLRRSGPCK